MCIGAIHIFCVGAEIRPAVMFMNTNRSEFNIRRKIRKAREQCRPYGIELLQECVVSKGPDRNIDREAVNKLIDLLLKGRYEIVVVNSITDITDDWSDLEEFIRDADGIGVQIFELSRMKYISYEEAANRNFIERLVQDARRRGL